MICFDFFNMSQGWLDFFWYKRSFTKLHPFSILRGTVSKLYKDKFDTFLTANLQYTNSLT